MVMEVLAIRYQQQAVGAISFDTLQGYGAFEYDKAFLQSGIQLSPIHMPLQAGIFTFPALDKDTFKGLPGLVADSLPDDFGNAVLDAWVATQGKTPADITPLQRLSYTGGRGMGALEYHPAILKNQPSQQQVHIESLVRIAQDILDSRQAFSVSLPTAGQADHNTMLDLLSVGTSAGGARPKAVLAFNADFTQVRSGQANVPQGFTHYMVKFDGVQEQIQNRQTFGDPLGYGAMEYVYSRLARQCGIQMMPCHLLDEGSRRHFITQRFDREGNRKIHVQTLNGLAHVNYRNPGSYSYAQLLTLARQLRLPAEDAEQIFRRMVFNVMARNQDDHAKNIAFMLDADNTWRLAPAYDLAYSYKPGSFWVSQHWMSLNGKRDHFTRDDFYSFSQISPLFSRQKIDLILEQTQDSLAQWPTLATEHAVPSALIKLVTQNLRLAI